MNAQASGVSEVQAQSILQKSRLPEVEYVINPYTGCTHGCVYCYARFMKRFVGRVEPWGAFLDAKVNAPERLRQELQRRRSPLNGRVFLSSVTDPYLPAEKKYALTRRVLEVLLEFDVAVEILTKSDLVVRDLDLLQQFKHCRVGLSLLSDDDETGKRFDLRAAPPSRRIAALQELKARGIFTYAFVSPYLPQISDIERLFERLAGSIDRIGVEAFNPRGGNWNGVAEVLATHYPALLSGYQDRLSDATYWEALAARSKALASEYGLAFMGFFKH